MHPVSSPPVPSPPDPPPPDPSPHARAGAARRDLAPRRDPRARIALALLVAAGLLLRLLLALHSPHPDGYSYDPYWQTSQLLVATGHLPESRACWECYQPPLGALLGAPFYAIGLALSGDPDTAVASINLLGMLCGLLTVFYGYRVLRLLGHRPPDLVLGAAILLVFPCLFFASWSSESDVLVAALLAALLHELLRYQMEAHGSARQALVLAVLTAAAMSTKYSGLLALAPVCVVLALRLVTGPGRRRTLAHGALIALVALSLGSWKYVDNAQKYGDPFFEGQSKTGFRPHGTGSRKPGFHAHSRSRPKGRPFWKPLLWRRYDFASFPLGPLLDLYRADGPEGKLMQFRVYYDVWPTLHAMAWSDMSFFSHPGREYRYWPPRFVPVWLVGSVLVLGLLPDLLALAGFVASLARRELWPMAVLVAASSCVYMVWFLSQERWALKTKYLLFLLPAYVVYVLEGLGLVRRFLPRWIGRVVVAALVVLVVLTHAYLYRFAIG